jgi:hypothetical protein
VGDKQWPAVAHFLPGIDSRVNRSRGFSSGRPVAAVGSGEGVSLVVRTAACSLQDAMLAYIVASMAVPGLFYPRNGKPASLNRLNQSAATEMFENPESGDIGADRGTE